MLQFIVNPKSGGEQGFARWSTIERELRKQGVKYKIHITDCAGDATDIADRITKDIFEPVTIVIIGGDGTVDEVINGVHFSDLVTIGYIPNGSGNDFARGMKMSSDPMKNLDIVLNSGNVKLLDYGEMIYKNPDGEIKTRKFAVSAGIGYDAKACHEVNESRIKRTLSKVKLQNAAYTIIGVNTFLHSKLSTGTVQIEDQPKKEYEDIFFISAHIHPAEGGGYYFTPDADPADGKLSVCIMNNGNKINLIKPFLLSTKGKHVTCEGVEIFDTEKISIHTDRRFFLHCDGEVFGTHNDVEFRCVKGQIRFIVP